MPVSIDFETAVRYALDNLPPSRSLQFLAACREHRCLTRDFVLEWPNYQRYQQSVLGGR